MDDPGVVVCAAPIPVPVPAPVAAPELELVEPCATRGGVGLGLVDVRAAAAAVMLANCGVVGLWNGVPDAEPAPGDTARPRIRCTMNGGTLCEPPACDPPRWCVGRVGDDGPALGSGGCGGRCEPLRR